MNNKHVKCAAAWWMCAAAAACNPGHTAPQADALKPVVVTAAVRHDSDDPAIWINPADTAASLVLGTDKDSDGALYVFDLQGKVLRKVSGLKRPNNVDVAYGLRVNGQFLDIAVTTERETNSLRVFRLPDMQPLDAGGIPVFEGEQDRLPMGVALYTRPADTAIFAIVSRKTGPADGYLFQYRLQDNGKGGVTAMLVRKFGQYSGKKEIESIAVDNELGFVYYSDEQAGVRKYYADPDRGGAQLAFFGRQDFMLDNEGISIYKTSDSSGYILVSDQEANAFNVYRREGDSGAPHQHTLLKKIPVSAINSDGSEVTNIPLGTDFPSGLFVAMSTDHTFHYYDWRQLERLIR
ncbi:phytase [uncultured Chitinophaga sp.]|jgi:3-phytase (myo-inositol-hexaphosphate 3-phosphohydrolase)|uniref:phytase n=1 Tax=uncultured Chitinophaga sp. TaxID=339340 RepID=UPI0026099588|nr:phytase [uncultured Chitinophaga sp.]